MHIFVRQKTVPIGFAENQALVIEEEDGRLIFINRDELQALPFAEKTELIEAILGAATLGEKLEIALLTLGCGVEKDNQGQIVLYTDMTYDEDHSVIPFAKDDKEPDSLESCPSTIPSHLMPSNNALVEAAHEAVALNEPIQVGSDSD